MGTGGAETGAEAGGAVAGGATGGAEAGWAEAGWAEAGWAEAGWAEAGGAEAGRLAGAGCSSTKMMSSSRSTGRNTRITYSAKKRSRLISRWNAANLTAADSRRSYS